MVDYPSSDVFLQADLGQAEEDQSFRDLEYVSKVRIGGRPVFWAIKRLSDIVSGGLLIAIVLLLMPLIWLINLKFNPGPLFYRQRRIGRNLKTFHIWKLRTMVGSSDVSRFATDEHDRITPFGNFLRRTHIDEMPQGLNILLGQMSLVGPRPEQTRFAEEYLTTIPFYRARYLVRPGLTGLAQVEYGYTHNHRGTATKLKYDLLYIRKSGFRMEFCVYYKTVIHLARKLFHKA